ncbi:MAG: hypothetical protein JHC26_05130 [Thermofilum sp.]|uniref:hypothetical protein n=1 Tax=Thermofilum sp. TaxID=1961369 RepID=UPI00258CC7DD|nr:hypothetical protein [Thermofilum sp.]MCI4408453.1 hypothetical protein [Thermofilum sp.]
MGSKPAFFWHTFSLPIAYVIANAYLNVNSYVDQLGLMFNAEYNVNYDVNGYIAVALFLALFITPNVLVFSSLSLLKNDVLSGKIQNDISIISHARHIEVSGKRYTLGNSLNNCVFSPLLISFLILVIDYSRLQLLLLMVLMVALAGFTVNTKQLILCDPYLRLKYDVYTLWGEGKTLYLIIEKEKEFEYPVLNNYVISWFYGHSILVGFKKDG